MHRGRAEEGRIVRKLMAMGHERSKPLHNFSLPCLKWGNQRFLRCVKVPPDASDPSSVDRRSSRLQPKFDQFQAKQINPRNFQTSPENPLHNSKRKSNIQNDSDNNIEEVREKLMVDLKVAAKKLKVSVLGEGGVQDETAGNAKPWNLRTRRAACKSPQEETKKCDLGSSPIKGSEAAVPKENPVSVEKNERVKLSISLSKGEVEEDFALMVGTRPPRRPKKRPKIVQRQMDSLFPGLWLSEVTPESYKVPDDPE
ncbi:DUF1639 family protein [Quillaja saponaria]|uniref:DUF1639 family protein n=1 Tax=Quillaja saponaria TaxID=32244 RepID=A0AAD7PW15_QUISA|nr:DUF1639 family protein [Quillaja saponaria]